MLERHFPNLYGWFVWGGGIRVAVAVLKAMAYGLLVSGIFLLGGWLL